MNITVDRQPKCLAHLQIEVPATSVAEERQKIVNAYTREARIPGFRPGKAPQKVIEKRYGKDIHEEVEARLINQSFDETLKQNKDLRILDFGSPTITHNTDGSCLVTSNLMLAPAFELPDYQNIALTVPSEEVSEESINNTLEDMRKRGADFKTIEGRAANEEDLAVIDFTSTLDGKPLEEALGRSAGYIGGREGFWVRIKDDSFLPGFAMQLIGLNTGDQKDIQVTLPDDFPLSDLRGKNITVHTTLKEIKEQILPELNDELAAKFLGEGKTLADLREQVTGYHKSTLAQEIEDVKVRQLIEYFDAKVDFEIPDALVQAETQSQVNQMTRDAYQNGATEDDLQAQQAEIIATATTQAKTNIKTNFILQQIAEAEKIAVSDQELVQHLIRISQQRREKPDKLIKQLQRAGRIPGIRNSLLVNKTLDYLIEKASVTTTDPA